MTESELRELEELRLFKACHEGRAINRAFGRLEQLISIAQYDPIMSVRAFRVLADCLICLKEALDEKR